jgi:LysM repeat protein
MKSRLVLLGVGVIAMTGLSACGSDGGTNAAPQTTIKLAQADYVTAVPILTSTVPPTTLFGQSTTTLATSVSGEQEYIVQDGDILTRIGKKYGVSATAIADYNQWTEGIYHLIYQGLPIKIPPGATIITPGGPPVTNANGTPAVTTTTAAVGPGGTYVIVDGDTLTRIANKNGTTVAAIIKVNGWTDGTNHLIYKGLEIKLPAKAG